MSKISFVNKECIYEILVWVLKNCSMKTRKQVLK